MTGFRVKLSTSFWLLLTLLAGLTASTAWAEAVDSLPKPTDYVSDNAHVLSAETVARLDRLCTQLDHSAANAQVAVVTVHTLDGDEAADYGTRLYHKMGIGVKGSDRGILVLLAVDDHKRFIVVGYGLEGILPDAKVGDIGRAMVPYLRTNDFDSAVTLAVSQVGQVIAEDAKVTLEDEPGQPVMVQRPVRHSSGLSKLILILILLVFFGGSWLTRLLMGFGLFGMLGGGRGPWMGGGGFGGGGGGDGGGSGFGGFGGGDSGGGGAGGDW
jgi:uncharacterized protein